MKVRNVGRLALGAACVLTVLTGASVVSATPQATAKLTGYTFAEARVSVPAGQQRVATAKCPKGDEVVGGGGYEVTQNNVVDLNSSAPNGDRKWAVNFNNWGDSSSNTGVAVAICAEGSSLADYSIQSGTVVTIPAGGVTQATVTCPTGTVDLGGGWVNESTSIFDSNAASAPYGTNGWRAFPEAFGPNSEEGYAEVVCATRPSNWVQVSSSYVDSPPTDSTTTVTVACPKGTEVLGGGGFDSIVSNWRINIGLTSSLSSLKGWSITENNNSDQDDSVDAWAVCAKTSAS